MFLCGLLEVVLDSKKRLVYEPPIPPWIFAPIYDGEIITYITFYAKIDRFLQRLGIVVLEECDLKRQLWTQRKLLFIY